MSPQELDQLVAQIGERILSRVDRPPLPQAEGLNVSDLVCPGCTQRCAQTCATKTRVIVAQGADRVTAGPTLSRLDPSIASLIDHTILKPEATREEVLKICSEAKQFSFASVCVNSHWVPLVAQELKGTPVKVCTVVGFPLGAASTEAKVHETAAAVRVGAQEVDMVINIGALKGREHDVVKQDIQSVVEVAHRSGALVKVILETALLDDTEKAIGCTLAKLAGADFVKTSTGFSKHGATAHDVALMRAVVGPDLGVKAAGGIRTLDDVKAMTAAGATRIGASASVKIVEGATLPGSGY